ncbi:hypothetical protein Raf01_39270 [Rugosimonospora africana]|uniref:Uncharacterized protein n=1 Tax=Rugosimonospora africana TaxID=556532 RepID=A0A8J3QU00_9ACTN|nr:hypothetical protein Raf01_39270 [Rugosimonospora africana]
MTGLIRQAATPVSAKPPAWSPRVPARHDRYAHSASTSTTAAAQAAPPYRSPPSRAAAPRSDWFDTYPVTPTRPVSHNAPAQ